jgi:hypothetical protein
MEPLTRGLPTPNPRSLCPLSSTEFVEKPRTKIPGVNPPKKNPGYAWTVSYFKESQREFRYKHTHSHSHTHSHTHSLETEVSCMHVVPRQIAVHRRGGAEHDVGTQVVLAFLAELTETARHTGLYGHTVSCGTLKYTRVRLKYTHVRFVP